jgi:GTP-binding protein
LKFIDTAEIRVEAGHGGVGCVSFRREKHVPKGGPDGGNGGRGGDVILRANRHLNTLLDFHYRRTYRAQRGAHGLGAKKTGRSGTSVVLEVPIGTLVKDHATGEVIADLVRDGEEFVVVHGGKGGRGNAMFATSTNQAPRIYEQGEDGEEKDLTLELKLLADVGLLGLPNAGKSTLISVISSARPKIADYPFTTLVPNLGIARLETGKSFVVADIPGLIEGAHLGKGLGLQFLRHVERTRVLAFLVDAVSEDPVRDYKILLNELRLFDASMLKKPRLVVITRTDLVSPARVKELERLRFPLQSSGRSRMVECYPISSVRHEGIQELLGALWGAVNKVNERSRRRVGA